MNFNIFIIVLINILVSSSGEALKNALGIITKGVKDIRVVPIPKAEEPKGNVTAKKTYKIRLTRKEILEVDCVDSMFMSPFHDTVEFTVNASISTRVEPLCKWLFVGTEPCIPMITCTDFALKPSKNGQCNEEYLEIFDGDTGRQRYCGTTGPERISAANDVRDLYLTFKTAHVDKVADPSQLKFKCSVSCSNRGDGTPLPSVFKPDVNFKCKCGTKPNQNRIVGGQAAKKSEFPWIAALVESHTRQPFCGGSIINNLFILTAAHCIKGKFVDVENINVILYGHVLDSTPNTQNELEDPIPMAYDDATLQKLDKANGSMRLFVEEIIVHPLYVSETNDFDVALLRLQKPIDFFSPEGKGLIPICLPKLGSYLRTFGKKTAIVAGWGLPAPDANGTVTTLQKLEVNVFPPATCKDFYAHRVNRRMVCAGYKDGRQDSCSGDSGGPLIVEDTVRTWFQIGTVSWGESCAVPGNPGVYFRTTESGQWIHYNSNSHDATWCQVPKD